METAPTETDALRKQWRWLAAVLGLAVSIAAMVWCWWDQANVDRTKVYRIGYGNDAPLHFPGADGQPTGLAVDLIQEAARRSGIHLEWIHHTGFNKNLLDLWVVHANTPERRKGAHLTEPYLQSENCFIVLADSPVRDARDLQSARISVHRSQIQRSLLAQFLPHATLLPAISSAEALEVLTSGRADALFVNQYAVLASLLRGGRQSPLRVLPAPVPKVQLSLASTFALAPVADLLRQELDAMAEDGSLPPIVDRWAFFPRPTAEVIGELALAGKNIRRLAAGMVGLAVLLGVMIWLALLARRRANQLARAENLLRQVTDRVPGMVYQFRLNADGTTCIPYSSDAIRQIYRVSPEEVRESVAKIQAVLHPEDVAEVNASIRQSAQDLSPWRHEFRVKHADGAVRWMAGNARPQREPDGATLWHGFITDITDRKVTEEAVALFERRMQETQKLESLGVLAGGIAHDFNNILTSVLGSASLAALELPAGSPVQKHVESIRVGSLRAADLCRQMLAYSGKGRFVVKKVSLNAVIEETTQLLRVSINKSSTLRFNLQPNLPALEADATQLRQVIMNLVINSSEAIGTKPGVINVNTRLVHVDRDCLDETIPESELSPGTYLQLEVSDTGCGMSAETQARIFEPFYTTKFTGRGLGLSAVLGIVRGHGGALTVDSRLGRGTTFRLLFPCADEGADSDQAEPVARMAWKPRGKVLVVDDEETVRTIAACMLRQLGFDVTEASDGREAVRIFAADPAGFRLVLLDLTMPHLGGNETLVELRRIRDDVPVVVMSGFSEHEVASRFSGWEISGFLQKPFPYETLDETLFRATEVEVGSGARSNRCEADSPFVHSQTAVQTQQPRMSPMARILPGPA